MKSSVSETFLCAGCACLCDDIPQVDINVAISQASAPLKCLCPLGADWYFDRDGSPRNQPADLDAYQPQIDQIVAILQHSRNPLIHGGSRSAISTVRAMLALSESARAIFDGSESEGSDWNLAVQSQGISTATWGEVRDRADVLIYLGFDVSSALPRHSARFGCGYSPDSGAGNSTRWVATIGGSVAPHERGSLHVPLTNDDMLSFLQSMRRVARGHDVDRDCSSPVQGSILERLVREIRSARFAAIVIGPQLGTTVTQRDCLEQLLAFVRATNTTTRCVCIRESGRINTEGVLQVTTWQSGFPGAVRFTQGFPQYDPWGATTRMVLESGEVDFVLSVESDIDRWQTPKMQAHLAKIPHAVVDYRRPGDHGSQAREIRIPTSVPGRDYEADFCRSDGMWISSGAPPAPSSTFLPAYTILDRIRMRIASTP
jgi:formylmethanofuran dehydrogenase subunit B